MGAGATYVTRFAALPVSPAWFPSRKFCPAWRPSMLRIPFVARLLIAVVAVLATAAMIEGPWLLPSEAGLFRRRCRARRCCPPPCSQAQSAQAASAARPQVRQLFDGKTLAGWEVSDFAGHGEVEVQGGNLYLGTGLGLTGAKYAGGHLPKDNYEISLEAKRTAGVDFFCAITFPVGDSFCTFVPGGWGGGVVGLSNIDDYDASENETTTFMAFDDDTWYRFRVRVAGNRIQCWINDRMAINQSLEGHTVKVRIDIEEACPLGLSSFASTAQVRNVAIRPVDKPAKGEVQELKR